MDLNTEKLRLIEWICQIEDEKLIKEMVELMKQSVVVEFEEHLKPMTVEVLIERSRASDADIAAGRVHSLDDVMKDFE